MGGYANLAKVILFKTSDYYMADMYSTKLGVYVIQVAFQTVSILAVPRYSSYDWTRLVNTHAF